MKTCVKCGESFETLSSDGLCRDCDRLPSRTPFMEFFTFERMGGRTLAGIIFAAATAVFLVLMGSCLLDFAYGILENQDLIPLIESPVKLLFAWGILRMFLELCVNNGKNNRGDKK